MENYQNPQARLYFHKIHNRTLIKLESYTITVRNQPTFLDIAVKNWKSNRRKEKNLRAKTRNIRQLDHLHPVFIANEKIILWKNAGAVLMPLTDLNRSNKTNQQTKQEEGKNRENRSIQDLYRFLKFT